MRKIYFLLIIPLALLVLLAIFLFITSYNSICMDKGGSATYFEKSYYLTHLSEFNNDSSKYRYIAIPKEETLAEFSVGSRCSDRGVYLIRKNGELVKVSAKEFNAFISNSTSLLVQYTGFNSPEISEVSSKKVICNDYLNSYNISCINISNNN